MHAAGAAIIAQVGNGEGLNAALGAMAGELAGGKINEFAREMAKNITKNSAAQETLANLISSIAANAIGAAAGGESGASAAANADKYNRQMHPDQQARLAILCASDPENCDKYRAAACALTDCGTDLPDGDPYKSFLMDLEILGQSDEYKIARDILNDNGLFDKRSGQNVFGRIGEWGLFTLTYYLDREYWNREYIEEKRGAFGTWSDYQNAWLMRHDEGLTRAMGGASVGIGGASILGGSASMETAPWLSSFMIASGILLYKGGSDMLLGDYQSSLGADIYNSLNKPWESHLGFDLTAQRQLEAALAILDLGALKTLTKVLPKGKSGFVEMPTQKPKILTVDDLRASTSLRNADPIGSALKADKYHASATFMREEAAKNGKHFTIIGNDGQARTLTQIPGELNGQKGRFEYIVDNKTGKLTHQMFVKGGSINGVPIKP